MTPPLPEGLRAGGRFAAWEPGVPAYLVADVDGTMIARGTTATPAVAAAVARAHDAGLRVGLATGRLPVGIRDLEAQLAFEGPHIVHNGSEIVEGGRTLHTWPLTPEQAVRIRDTCLEHGFYTEFFLREGFLATDRREAARGSWEAISGEPRGLIAGVDLARTEILKATVVAFSPGELPRVMAALDGLGLVAEAASSPLFPGHAFVNVNGPGADKGRALVHVAGHLGIGLPEVVAVGDGINDVSMFAVAGTGVAMGQSPPAVVDAAHLVVPEVDADGVAHALRAAAAWRVAAAR